MLINFIQNIYNLSLWNIIDRNVTCDASVDYQIGFQDPATPVMEGIIQLYQNTFFFLTIIAVFVSWLLFKVMVYFHQIKGSDGLFYSNLLHELAHKYSKNIPEKDTWHYLVFLIVTFFWKHFIGTGASRRFYKYSIFFRKRKTYYEGRYNSTQNRFPARFTHHTMIEVVWTLVPCMILIIVAVQSFSLLYSMDEVITPQVTVKAIGHQWYWSYEYADSLVKKINDDEYIYKPFVRGFNSYMLLDKDLSPGFLRLLDVDNRTVLPESCHVRLLVTSADVIHSWAVPSLGVKLDACPGRLNQTILFVKREGVFYGQCSEICGINHAFMPIVVDVCSVKDFMHWIYKSININSLKSTSSFLVKA